VKPADVTQLFRLDGRVAIVTGASRGLGEAIAGGFAAAGAKVVCASRKLADLERVVAQIQDDGGEALAVACHMGDPAQVRALVERALAAYGRLDIVVNNAGTPQRFGIAEFDESKWHKALEVNAMGPLVLISAAIPALAKSHGASVINITTTGVQHAAQSSLGYGSAKAALTHATPRIAAELARQKIRVNAIAPGPFATRMMQTTDEKFLAAATRNTVQKRIAEPAEIVGAALFLASDASSFVTGQVLNVDGGMLG
jgi:NAD(P)-dependent dehydrogenase (short-subunit alcohol dehydrogenase family)